MSCGKLIGCSLIVLASANVFADRGSRHHAPAFDGEDSQRIVEGLGQTGAEVDGYVAAACHHAHEHEFYSCVVTTGHGVAIEMTGRAGVPIADALKAETLSVHGRIHVHCLHDKSDKSYACDCVDDSN